MSDEYMPRMTRAQFEAALERAREEVREELEPDAELRNALLAGNWRDSIDKDVLDGFFQAELEVRLREINISPTEKERIVGLGWDGAY